MHSRPQTALLPLVLALTLLCGCMSQPPPESEAPPAHSAPDAQEVVPLWEWALPDPEESDGPSAPHGEAPPGPDPMTAWRGDPFPQPEAPRSITLESGNYKYLTIVDVENTMLYRGEPVVDAILRMMGEQYCLCPDWEKAGWEPLGSGADPYVSRMTFHYPQGDVVYDLGPETLFLHEGSGERTARHALTGGGLTGYASSGLPLGEIAQTFGDSVLQGASPQEDAVRRGEVLIPRLCNPAEGETLPLLLVNRSWYPMTFTLEGMTVLSGGEQISWPLRPGETPPVYTVTVPPRTVQEAAYPLRPYETPSPGTYRLKVQLQVETATSSTWTRATFTAEGEPTPILTATPGEKGGLPCLTLTLKNPTHHALGGHPVLIFSRREGEGWVEVDLAGRQLAQSLCLTLLKGEQGDFSVSAPYEPGSYRVTLGELSATFDWGAP